MSFFKKLPRTSLLLLLFTHSVFGWLLSVEARRLDLGEPGALIAETAPSDIAWVLWILGAIYVLLIALTLTAPLTLIQTVFSSWLKSDARAFISVLVGAFVAVIVLHWLYIFIRIAVLLAAGALARLDLQTADYGEWQAFGIIASVSLLGFGMGIAAYQWVG
jgi:hypothetical protein